MNLSNEAIIFSKILNTQKWMKTPPNHLDNCGKMLQWQKYSWILFDKNKNFVEIKLKSAKLKTKKENFLLIWKFLELAVILAVFTISRDKKSAEILKHFR